MQHSMYDIISKKKRGECLSNEEISFFVEGYTDGSIPDYQASALLMAICIRGMEDAEITALTMAMADSGDRLDLSRFANLSVDKHSTGGVGDKTSLIVAPIAASLGCKVAKMSGRGLGHTGGTVDKLESFPGFKTSLSAEEFTVQVSKIGLSVIGQSADLAPADKKLYALRDVTATVDSIPLITASIMSKKLAAGSHSIVLDVKYGSGGFMKTPSDAEALATGLVEIGKRCGRRMCALITNMDIPLGYAIGNALEVKEAIEVLSGRGPDDLREVCISLATEMVGLALGKSESEARECVLDAISSGRALAKFCEWIECQGGDAALAKDPSRFPKTKHEYAVLARESGYISAMNAEDIGIASVALGAGRATKDDVIDHAAGIVLAKKCPDAVNAGDVLAYLYTNDESKIAAAEKILLGAIRITDECPTTDALIYKTIR